MNLSDETASATNIQSTHAIDIFAFVEAEEIPFSCFEAPYYLAPAPGGERVYALLRETLNRTKKIAIAHVVIQTHRRLAALIPCGPLLMLNTLRISGRVSSPTERRLRRRSLKAGDLTEKELAAATTVVRTMTKKWDVSRCPEPPGDERGRRPLRQRSGARRNTETRAGRDSEDILRPPVRMPNNRGANTTLAAGGPQESRTTCQEERDGPARVRARRTYH